MVILESGLMVMLLFTTALVHVDPLVVITIGNVVGVVFVVVGFPVISINKPPFVVSTTAIVSPSFPSTSFNDTYSDQIQSFNFSDSNNATDVGTLSAACFSMGSNLHY